MDKPIKPTKNDKYRKIGDGYVSPVDDAINLSTTELKDRIEIVPYTSTGERDVLGLNTIECLETIQGMLEEAQNSYLGYEDKCDSVDDKIYNDALDLYNRRMDEYNKSLEKEDP